MGMDLQRAAALMGLEPEDFLDQHTVFPYAVAFMPLTVRRALREKFLQLSSKNISIASLTKVITHGVPVRRFCHDCVALDRQLYGEAYWHRNHHLPGVLICPIHLSRLVETTIPLRGNTRTSNALLPPLPNNCRPVLEQRIILEKVAQLSFLALNGHIENDLDLHTHYRQAAFQKGYGRTKTDLAAAVFSREFKNFFGPDYLHRTGCAVQGRPWPGLMLHGSRSLQFAAPKHILMQTFLTESADADRTEFESYPSPGPRLPDFFQRDQAVVAKLCDIVAEVEQQGARMTVKELITRAGMWQSFRHHRKQYPLTGQFLQEFRRSDLAERQVGGRPYWRSRFPMRFAKI
jgi:hypothetical protein